MTSSSEITLELSQNGVGGQSVELQDQLQDDTSTPLMIFGIDSRPPWYVVILCAAQQASMCIMVSMSLPLIVSTFILCSEEDNVLRAQLFSTSIFMTGITTLLQCTIGVRLPIIQGGNHGFVPGILAILALEHLRCESGNELQNTTMPANHSNVSDTMVTQEAWRPRLLELQGGILTASVIQVVIGITGAMGFLLRFIGPLTIIPILAMIGLGLYDVCSGFAQDQWGIWALCCALIFISGVYMQNLKIPVPRYSRKNGCHKSHVQIFALIPVLLSLAISWTVCAILTSTDSLPSDPNARGYKTRTDTRLDAVTNAEWFYFPYPGQFGMPVFSVPSFLAMLAVTFASIVESVGDYHAAARLCDMPPPPAHAINRGILIEGIGSIISGAVGSGHATTSYSGNVGVMAITKTSSLRVFQVAGLMMIICGVVGKFGAVLATIPDPIQGGILVVCLGMVASVGLSNLQYLDMNSSRNLAILGFSLLVGLMVPDWMKKNPAVIKTGSIEFDQVVEVFLSTSMLLAGTLGFLLDNTVPGTREQRGLVKMQQFGGTNYKTSDGANISAKKKMKIYEWPYVTKYLRANNCVRYIPFCPTFSGEKCSCRKSYAMKHNGI